MPNLKKLKNGITVLTDYVSSVETVCVGMWVYVGARNETSANNGVAHLLEHMAFKGTKNRTAKQISDEVEMIGGHVNAYTSREITAYHMKVLKEDIKTSENKENKADPRKQGRGIKHALMFHFVDLNV